MRLTARINRLECNPAFQCPMCRGEGKWVVVHRHDDEPAPPAPGCPACGQANTIIVRYVRVKSIPGSSYVPRPEAS